MGSTYTEKMKEAVRIAKGDGLVLVATSDERGTPHIGAGGGIEMEPDAKLAVTEWFCPTTLENLTADPALSVVVWDRATDEGYQFLGRLERIQDMGVLDGLAPGEENEPPLPQVLRKLVIEVEEVLAFKRGPHSDSALQVERG